MDTSDSGDLVFSMVGDPGGREEDMSRKTIHVRTWMRHSDVLTELLLRRREICLPGGTQDTPGPEPIRISHIPLEPTYADIIGLPHVARCAFRLCPELMHERIVCDLALSYL